MFLRDYGPYFILPPWNYFCGQGFSHGLIGPSNYWYTQVPVSELHMVDPVQYFTHLVKGFPMDNLWCASSFLLSLIILNGVRLCKLHNIHLYPSGKVGAQSISPLITSSHRWLRFSKAYKHHPSASASIPKTLLVRTPPPCKRNT